MVWSGYVNTLDRMFMDADSVKEFVMPLKIKNSEGVDRVPQRRHVDGYEHLGEPLVVLFNLISKQKGQIFDTCLICKSLFFCQFLWKILKRFPIYFGTDYLQNVLKIKNLENRLEFFQI